MFEMVSCFELELPVRRKLNVSDVLIMGLGNLGIRDYYKRVQDL